MPIIGAAAKAVAKGAFEAKWVVGSQSAQQNVKMQSINVKAAMETGEQIPDIIT